MKNKENGNDDRKERVAEDGTSKEGIKRTRDEENEKTKKTIYHVHIVTDTQQVKLTCHQKRIGLNSI